MHKKKHKKGKNILEPAFKVAEADEEQEVAKLQSSWRIFSVKHGV
jgi:hypothetical protein